MLSQGRVQDSEQRTLTARTQTLPGAGRTGLAQPALSCVLILGPRLPFPRHGPWAFSRGEAAKLRGAAIRQPCDVTEDVTLTSLP